MENIKYEWDDHYPIKALQFLKGLTRNERSILENTFLPLFLKKVQQISSLCVKWGAFKDVPGSARESTSLSHAAGFP